MIRYPTSRALSTLVGAFILLLIVSIVAGSAIVMMDMSGLFESTQPSEVNVAPTDDGQVTVTVETLGGADHIRVETVWGSQKLTLPGQETTVKSFGQPVTVHAVNGNQTTRLDTHQPTSTPAYVNGCDGDFIVVGTETGPKVDATTLQGGVNAAQNSSCNTIVLQPGQHNGSATVTTDDLVIVGQADTRLVGRSQSETGLTIRGDNVQLRDVLVTRYTQHGVIIENASNTQLHNVRTNGNGGVGVIVDDGSKATILHQLTSSRNGQAGVVIRNHSRQTQLSAATVTDNSRTGVQLHASHATTITKSTITENGASGIVAVKTTHTFIEQTSVTNNLQNGIVVEDARATQFNTVTASKNSQYGIRVTDSENVTLRSITANDNEQAGFAAIRTTDVALQDGTLNANAFGIYLNTTTSTTITNADISDAAADGVLVSNTTKTTFDQIHVSGATRYGVVVSAAADTTLSESTVANSAQYNIIVTNSSATTVTTTTIQGATGGVAVQYDSPNTQLTENTITDHTGVGVTLTQGVPSATLKRNTLTGNKQSLVLGGRVNAPDVTVRWNHLGNVTNYDTTGQTTLDAAENWWGQEQGPVTGQVRGDVTVSPHCTTADCASFQP